MKIQYVSRYIELSKEGLVVKLECPTDQGPLFSNLDENDNIFLYCLECDYRRTLGIEKFNRIKEAVELHDKL